MNKSTHPLVIILLLVVGCSQNSGKQETADANSTSETIQPQYELEWTSELLLDTSEHYRGLVLLDDIAYAAGSNGQVFCISIQNTSAQLLMSIPGRHFRDIDLINDSTVLALAITEPAEIIRFNLNYPKKKTPRPRDWIVFRFGMASVFGTTRLASWLVIHKKDPQPFLKP